MYSGFRLPSVRRDLKLRFDCPWEDMHLRLWRRWLAFLLCWSLLACLWPMASVSRNVSRASTASASQPLFSSQPLPPCCCTPGMCHMAGCPANSSAAARSGGPPASSAFSPCSHGAAATLLVKIVPATLTASWSGALLCEAARPVPPARLFRLSSRSLAPFEQPPRCV